MDKLLDTFRKLSGWALLKQWLRAGVLPYAAAQAALTGLSRKSLEIVRLGVQLKIQRKLQKKYLPALKRFDEEWRKGAYAAVESGRRRVWICWLQGIDNAPGLVKKCYTSIREHIKDREIVLITSANRRDYIELPDYIERKYEAGIITHTHFSDLLRVALLAKYGGTWIDATVFCTGGTIPRYMLDSDFFVFQNLKPGADGHVLNMSNWFITAKAGNKFVLAIREMLFAYWKKKNDVADYFIFHMFFAMIANFYADDWKKVVPYSNSVPHILLLRLFERYDDDCYKELKRICPFHKLSYKLKQESTALKGTYYDVILNGNGANENI